LLDKLAKGESKMELVEQLFTKIRNNFGKTSKEERNIKQLRTIEQGGKTYDRSSRKLPGGVAMREDPSLKNSRGG